MLVPYEEPTPAVWALYSPTRHLSAKVRAFIDFLAERFRPARASETFGTAPPLEGGAGQAALEDGLSQVSSPSTFVTSARSVTQEAAGDRSRLRR